jgi:hypothetical protein
MFAVEGKRQLDLSYDLGVTGPNLVEFYGSAYRGRWRECEACRWQVEMGWSGRSCREDRCDIRGRKKVITES